MVLASVRECRSAGRNVVIRSFIDSELYFLCDLAIGVISEVEV